MMKKLMNKLIALGAMMFFGLTGCSNLNDAGNTLALDNSTQSDRCVVTVDTDAARAVIVAEYGESDINQWSLSAINVENSLDTYTTGNKTKLSDLSLTLLKDETYNFTLTGIVGTTEVPGAVKGEIAARKITGNTRLSFTVKPSDATSTADPNAKGMAELKFDITGMEVLEDPMTGHGYQFVAIGQSGNAARKNKNLELEFDETAKTFKIKNAVLSTGIWELGLVCGETAYCKGIYFAVEAGLTTKVTVVKENLTIPGTGEVTGIYKDGIKNFTPTAEDMLAANTKVQFEFDCDELGYKIAFENNAEGTPVYKLCLQEAEIGYVDLTEPYTPHMSANIDGDVYTFAMGSYACAIDTANKTYSWIFLDRYEDSVDTFTNVHIYVNGADIIDDLTYKAFVKPTAEDMLKPGAEVEINYIVDSVNLKLSWKNDAEGNPINAYLQEFDADGTKGYGEECSGVFENDEYIINLSWEYLRVNPKKKTYTFYEEDERHSQDSGEFHTLTSIKINGVDISGDFEYETFVKVEDLIAPEKEVWLKFVYRGEMDDTQFQLLFENDEEGIPGLLMCQESYLDSTLYYQSRIKVEVNGKICTFVLPLYDTAKYACIIDIANKTYTWRSENDSGVYTDAFDDFENTQILADDNDITPALTYKTYVNQTKLEDILTSNAEVKISYKNYSDKFYAKLNNGATKNPEIKYFENNGEDMTSTLGGACGGIIQNNDYYFISGSFALRIDTKNKKYSWYDRFGYVDSGNEFSDTVVVVNGKDITSELTYQTYVPVELMLQPKAKVQFNYTYDSISYEVNCENNEDGTPEYTLSGWNEESTGDNGILDTSSWSVSVDSVYTLTMGKRALIIDFADRTYSWYNPTTFEDTGKKCTSINIYVTTESVRNQNIMSGFTYKTYVKSN